MKKASIIIKIALVVIITISLSSCKKDNLELLSGSVWSFDDMSTSSENTDIQTWVALGKGLLTDGTLTFNEDGTYELTSPILEGQNASETGDWELQGNSLIIFTTGGVPRNATIDELKKDKLVFLETYLYLDTEAYTVKNTWVK